jgi:hypothetical protein
MVLSGFAFGQWARAQLKTLAPNIDNANADQISHAFKLD